MLVQDGTIPKSLSIYYPKRQFTAKINLNQMRSLYYVLHAFKFIVDTMYKPSRVKT